MSNNSNGLRNKRRDYDTAKLTETSLPVNPIDLCSTWFDLADAKGIDFHECALATANKQNKPTVRIVLLKHFDARGFCWYSDSTSTKGQNLASNNQAELLFYWQELNQQIRINGKVNLLSKKTTQDYFNTRPIDSQISAYASNQSRVIANRDVLEQRCLELKQLNKDITMPTRWQGYCLEPATIEFWQGRPNRLHDRISYYKNGDKWSYQRLSP